MAAPSPTPPAVAPSPTPQPLAPAAELDVIITRLLQHGLTGAAIVLQAERQAGVHLAQQQAADGAVPESAFESSHDRRVREAASTLRRLNSTAGSDPQAMLAAWEIGALVGGGGELECVLETLGANMLSKYQKAMRERGGSAGVPSRAYSLGLSDMHALARTAPSHCAEELEALAFALFACSFVELAAPPRGATTEAAQLFRLFDPVFESAHGVELAELRPLVGAPSQRLVGWNGSGRSISGTSSATGSVAAATGGPVDPSGVRLGSSEARVIAGPTFGPGGAGPHPAVEKWNSFARPYIVRLSPLSRSLALGTLHRRGHVVLLRMLTGQAARIKLVHSLTNPSSSATAGGWVLRLRAETRGRPAVVGPDVPAAADEFQARAQRATSAAAFRGPDAPTPPGSSSSSAHMPAAAAGDAAAAAAAAVAADAGEDDSGLEPVVLERPPPPRVYGEGAPLPSGSARLSNASSTFGIGFVQTRETPKTMESAALVAEATCLARAAAAAEAALGSQAPEASVAKQEAEARAVSRAAARAAAVLGADDFGASMLPAVTDAAKKAAEVVNKPMRSQLDVSATIARSAATELSVAAHKLDELGSRMMQERDAQARMIVEQALGPKKDHPEFQRLNLPSSPSKARTTWHTLKAGQYANESKEFVQADDGRWANVRKKAAADAEERCKEASIPGRRIAVARAFAAYAGIGRRPPRPAGMLDCDGEPSLPPIVAMTVLQSEAATVLAAGARRGTVAAGFADGHVLVWSNSRTRWAQRHEREPHRAATSGIDMEEESDEDEDEDEDEEDIVGEDDEGGPLGQDAAASGAHGSRSGGAPEDGRRGQGGSDGDAELDGAADEDLDLDVLPGLDADGGDDFEEDDDDDIAGARAILEVSKLDADALASIQASGGGSSSASRAPKRQRGGMGGGGEDDSLPSLAHTAVFSTRTGASGIAEAMLRPGRRRPASLLAHSGPVTALALSPGEDWLLTGSTDGSIRLWSIPAAQCVAVYRAAAGPVWGLEWSPGLPSFFASVHADGAARVWHTARPRSAVRMFHTFARSAEALAWHPGAHLLMVGASDGSVRVENVEEGRTGRLLVGHRAAITAACWSPCGRLAFTADVEGCVRCWDLAAGKSEGPVWAAGSSGRGGASCGARITALAVSPSSRLLAVAGSDSRISMWDISKWTEASARLRSLHSHRVPRAVPAPTRGRGGSSSAAADQKQHGIPPHVVTAEPEAEEAALLEQAAAAIASKQGTGDTVASEPSGLRIGPPVFGKSTRFGALAFSRDGVLLSAGVFVQQA
ncbi:hypothetical protein FNF31_01552 [Cafeteria roenbergensis]|uniref:Uncharacterized protein n=2 Tax=Cafeteria roenbergensis TaxID=33653 RepID=A0A5A8DSF0_CAFRO|nr:hypothetical protein FNF31_01552 [Cafeteria roenbergensis]KAA0168208.1 hypothetical protein FNF28_02626 [Cafeteria roenbergensis]